VGTCCKPDSKILCPADYEAPLRTWNLRDACCAGADASSKNLKQRIKKNTEDWRDLFPDSNGITADYDRMWKNWLGSAQYNQSDFRWHAQTHGGADCAKAAIDVNICHPRRRGGERQWNGTMSRGSSLPVGSGRKKRALVQTGDVVGDEARGAEAMVEDFDLDLATVGVAGKRKLDAEFRGAIETVGIVGKEDIGNVAAD
jgi:hypothetical protein